MRSQQHYQETSWLTVLARNGFKVCIDGVQNYHKIVSTNTCLYYKNQNLSNWCTMHSQQHYQETSWLTVLARNGFKVCIDGVQNYHKIVSTNTCLYYKNQNLSNWCTMHSQQHYQETSWLTVLAHNGFKVCIDGVQNYHKSVSINTCLYYKNQNLSNWCTRPAWWCL